MTHTVQLDEKDFSEIKSETKTFLLLKDDKNYVCGDTLILQMLDSRDELKMEIVCAECERPGLKKDYVIAGIKPKD